MDIVQKLKSLAKKNIYMINIKNILLRQNSITQTVKNSKTQIVRQILKNSISDKTQKLKLQQDKNSYHDKTLILKM